MLCYEDFFDGKNTGKPYRGWEDQAGDYMLAVDMAFLAVPECVKADSSARTALLKATGHIAEREEASAREGIFLPAEHIAEAFGLSGFEKFCMFLALLPELDGKYERAYGQLHDNTSQALATVGLASRLYRLLWELPAGGVLMPSRVFFKYILEDIKENSSVSRLSRIIRLSDKVFDFLTARDSENSFPEYGLRLEFPSNLPTLYLGEEIQDKICSILDSLSEDARAGKTALCLYGPSGAGKRLHVRHAARHINMPVLWCDASVLKKQINNTVDIAKNIIFYSILYKAILCLYNFELLEGGDENAASHVLSRLADNVDALFILSSREWRPESGSTAYTTIALPIDIPGGEKRIELWRRLAEGAMLDPCVDLTELSNKFNFTPGMIERAIREAISEARAAGEAVGSGMLYKACIRQSSNGLESKASRLKPAFAWEDLILPIEQKNMLLDACNHIKYRHVVLDRWGFDKKLPYGRGLSILFYGPPGTGKTMGAQVLANELGLEIYRIDLSQMVSKYIGETEKNLKEVFDEASNTSAILFFDEADALFGKRGEVRDSHDRYANMETSYLLQKMEEHEGITVLATNLLQNFDEAYRRRFKFMIHFPMPDQSTRRRLWEEVFPKRLPLGPDVDLDFMAERFEISGSSVKNIAVAASFLAAAEGRCVEMKHMMKALKNELAKAGKVVVRQDLGGYGDLL
ncbi:SpoVK/Ycf46/Vps4 family AAA+-type ATPase [Anaerobacterium chartisolvens]|uniref:SpoVK/Ycf46/Vps4 family AAA+-type ATPase n=1 Tax=Anaerobacterium chartisolvens TaxID=1297424 RepID=A0A369ASY1_9FIRM|nr:ATP-binding protein [Anaerobacterium chartisolvens]RCX11376.1 SpoVK/Ycf46/Vps4 family AAA+-type ATPase [Anaerobacterium chartisolvens]